MGESKKRLLLISKSLFTGKAAAARWQEDVW